MLWVILGLHNFDSEKAVGGGGGLGENVLDFIDSKKINNI